MKNKKLIQFLVLLNLLVGSLGAKMPSGSPRHPINLPPHMRPSRVELFQQDLVSRAEKKYAELSRYLRKVKDCLKDQTCSAKVLKEAGNAAAILAMLVAFAYVGKKAVAGILEEDRIVAPPVAKPVKIAEKERLPKFPEVPREQLTGKPMSAQQVAQNVADFFSAIRNLTPASLDYLDLIISQLEEKYGMNVDSMQLRLKGYSLIGAAMQAEMLRNFEDPDDYTNIIFVIDWLRANGVVPTPRERAAVLEIKNKRLTKAVAR